MYQAVESSKNMAPTLHLRMASELGLLTPRAKPTCYWSNFAGFLPHKHYHGLMFLGAELCGTPGCNLLMPHADPRKAHSLLASMCARDDGASDVTSAPKVPTTEGMHANLRHNSPKMSVSLFCTNFCEISYCAVHCETCLFYLRDSMNVAVWLL